MGKNKLAKFAEMAGFKNVIQVSFDDIRQNGYAYKGNWNAHFFAKDQPIILELGCGKGEYTIALAEKNPENNYIGIDIKGARMFTGAKYALLNGLENVGFVRTHIEHLKSFFAPGEISEIWLTFPDPQMKRGHKRLTSTMFLKMYSEFLQPGGLVHLKTDSGFMYSYTRAVAKLNKLDIVTDWTDIYSRDDRPEILNVRTFYEKQWLDRGIPTKYLVFRLQPGIEWLEPKEEFEKDPYRSFGRSARQ